MKTTTKRKKKPLSKSSEWTFPLIQKYDEAIAKMAESFHLDTYPSQIEVISAEQMLDAYSSVGMPVYYHHWSFGKHFLQNEKGYLRGHMGLAYEIVINANPCIAYLMEENTMAMQALVIAHACYGHNSFFKNNYLFKSWTNADAIVDYLLFAKKYLSECEERYGTIAVEQTLDSCHALMNYGVDRYKHPTPLSLREEEVRQKKREEYLQSQVNELWRRTLPTHKKKEEKETIFPKEPQENILYFFEKNAPLLEPWQREIIRIVRKIAQYFYPQKQTKVMNEGWATFWHYTLLNALYDEGLVTDGFMLEFLQAHTTLISQPPFDSQHYSGISPYTLGFTLFSDLKRICESPTEEDKTGFPDIAGRNWVETLHFAMQNFKDESFIAQYLSPKVIRDLKLFSIHDDDQNKQIEISAIHDDAGYSAIRQTLSNQYNLSVLEPNIQVYRVHVKGDRTLILRYYQYQNRNLGKAATEVVKHVYRLWGFPVILETLNAAGEVVKSERCPEE